MRPSPPYTQLYQIYTRVYLNQLATQLGHAASLDDISDLFLQDLSGQGFNWLYLLGIWETGQAARQIALANLPLRNELIAIYPALQDEDIVSSCFAVTGYQVHPDFGGDAALDRLRRRMASFNLHLMLDFIPNHVAVDHPWKWEHPEFILTGEPDQLAKNPDTYFTAATSQGERILAHGRDPYFPAWNDTLQLNYSSPVLIEAMTQELLKVSRLCDGVRCDMAMLILPEVFQRTWGVSGEPFWPQAIQRVRAAQPDFTFLAEVYWHLEGVLLEQGFDFTYDKRYYDHLARREVEMLRGHLRMDPAMLARMAHFLENHDEKRASLEFPSPAMHQAAALLTYLVPGLRFFQHGQLEGYRIRTPMQLAHPLEEPTDQAVKAFYINILECLKLTAIRQGEFELLEAEPMCVEGGYCFPVFSFAWHSPGSPPVWVIVNYSSEPALCTLHPPAAGLSGQNWALVDRLNDVVIECEGDDLISQGLSIKLGAWSAQVFEVLESTVDLKSPR